MVIKVVIEGSLTPIYQRIVNGLSRSLGIQQHHVLTIMPGAETPLEFVQRINLLKPDLVVISNMFGVLSAFSPIQQCYIYELILSPIVFLHYDNILGPINDWNEIKRRFGVLVDLSGKSSHFCIEDNNIADFQKLSIQNVNKIYHSTDFDFIGAGGEYLYDISFVGHVMPESIFFNSVKQGSQLIDRALVAYRKRREGLDYRIEESAKSFANQVIPPEGLAIDWLAAKQMYRAFINSTSLYLRGYVLASIADNFDVDVIGGNPSYLNNRTGTQQLDHKRVCLHTPNKNHKGTDKIYAASKININITSIQFDTAIVNRVLDVAAVGGFLLTDWKEDLREITSVCELISYRTVDELKDKIDYYLTHDAERLEIANQLHNDVGQKYSYDKSIATILEAVEN